jgi:ubiquinone/menaquinone biosynthesis C-methylase UbiE
MTDERRGLKRFIGGAYSYAADKFYDGLIVKGAFRLFGGRLNEHVLKHGRRAVEIADGKPILDMPVGTGYFTLDVARTHKGLVVGTDIAEGMVVQARRNAEAAGLDNLSGIRADAHHLPFADGAFAAVLCHNGLQVIPGLIPTVTELVRVLESGGTMFVSVVAAPAGGILPERSRRHLPTMLRPRADVAQVLLDSGLTNVQVRHERLAALYEAVKP